MHKPKIELLSETQRLVQLRELAILDTAPDRRLDRITRMASEVFQVPMALITLIDEHRQWFKSKVGIDGEETPREVAFCAVAIQQPRQLIVLDASRDERFAHNPYVTGDPNIRFYAGAPLITPEGAALGTLCVVGTEPRDNFDAREQKILGELADLAMVEILKLKVR